jgi:hypothetical protein
VDVPLTDARRAGLRLGHHRLALAHLLGELRLGEPCLLARRSQVGRDRAADERMRIRQVPGGSLYVHAQVLRLRNHHVLDTIDDKRSRDLRLSVCHGSILVDGGAMSDADDDHVRGDDFENDAPVSHPDAVVALPLAA